MKEIKYIKVDGLLYPDLKLPTQKEIHLSKYGRMKLKYLKEHRRIIYTNSVSYTHLDVYKRQYI